MPGAAETRAGRAGDRARRPAAWGDDARRAAGGDGAPPAAGGDRGRRSGPILVALRDLGLGDFLTGIPALRALARAFPEHPRVLVAPAVPAPLLALPRTGFELWPDPPPGADVAVNLHGRGPQSH